MIWCKIQAKLYRKIHSQQPISKKQQKTSPTILFLFTKSCVNRLLVQESRGLSVSTHTAPAPASPCRVHPALFWKQTQSWRHTGSPKWCSNAKDNSFLDNVERAGRHHRMWDLKVTCLVFYPVFMVYGYSSDIFKFHFLTDNLYVYFPRRMFNVAWENKKKTQNLTGKLEAVFLDN